MSERSRDRLGALLRDLFAPTDPPPSSFSDLLTRLAAADLGKATLRDIGFQRALTAIIPDLRSYARSLARDRDAADDLVQEAVLKAWGSYDRFVPGTNIRAWCSTILRNIFISGRRRARFSGEWDDLAAERLLARGAEQESCVALADLRRALDQLPPAQREAVMLVGAGGLAYEEVARIANVPIGTVKSRVARGRVTLEALIRDGQLAVRRHDDPGHGSSALDRMLTEVEGLSGA